MAFTRHTSLAGACAGEGIAARWTTASIPGSVSPPLSASSAWPKSVTSARRNGIGSSGWLDSGEPTRSMLRTWWPRANRWRTTTRPALPLPPVTAILVMPGALADAALVRLARIDQTAARSCSSPRERSGPPTTAWASATCCAAAVIAWCSWPRSRSPGRSRPRGSRSGSCASRTPPGLPEAPGQFWKDFIRDTAPVFRSSTQEQLAGFILPTWQALVEGARYVDGRLTEIFDELAPDVDRRGQRVRVSRHPGQRPALGADRVLQPAGGHRPRSPAHVLGAGARGPHQLGGVPRRVRGAGRRPPGLVLGVLRRARRPAACRRRR